MKHSFNQTHKVRQLQTQVTKVR